jgi:hypothetical protein
VKTCMSKLCLRSKNPRLFRAGSVNKGASLVWKRILYTDEYEAWWLGEPVIGIGGKQLKSTYDALYKYPEGELSDSQKVIVNNLRVGREIYYSPTNGDIKHLLDAKIIEFVVSGQFGDYQVISKDY